MKNIVLEDKSLKSVFMLKTRSCRIAMLCMSPLPDYRYHNGVDDHGICMTHLTGICNRQFSELFFLVKSIF